MRATTSGQAKLLLLGLLRTVSAWAGSATTPEAATATRGFSASAGTTRVGPPTQPSTPSPSSSSSARSAESLPPLTLRLARKADVLSIQRCNLATLPENYNQQFYLNHMREWPDLAFVAVDESAAAREQGNGHDSINAMGGGGSNYGGLNPTSPFESVFPQNSGGSWNIRSSETSHRGGGGGKVVAYVLGKVEERTVLIPEADMVQGSFGEYENGRYRSSVHYPQHVYTTERLGHVTSLAVLEEYRRRGLAVELMKQLHYHLAFVHRVDCVGLHVRQSNRAAERLYANFGYEVDGCIPSYYQDGEDAYFMKKRLPAAPGSNNNRMQGGGGLFGTLRRFNNRPWETGPEDLRLPRTVGVPRVERQHGEMEHEQDTPELLTGTM